jgi:hypothetical protein
MESLITLLVVILIFGLILWAVRGLPVAEPFRSIAYVVVILILILYLLRFVGVVRL